MENRIQRAQAKAINNQYEIMVELLLQYQQYTRLGEKILHDAQASNKNKIEIETLSTQAHSIYLDILDNIFQEVPQKYQENIEDCRQIIQQFQTQAQHRYQEQGSSNSEIGGDKSDPSAGHGESGNRVDDSGNGTAESSSTANDPDSGTGEPGSNAGDPGRGTSEPGSNAGDPGSGSGEPGSGSGEPGNDTGNSGNGTGGSS
jgi:hypothetical protein